MYLSVELFAEVVEVQLHSSNSSLNLKGCFRETSVSKQQIEFKMQNQPPKL
jgi:hypothetical protein